MPRQAKKLPIEIKPALFDIEQAQSYLGNNIGRDKVRELMNNGIIKASKIGANQKLVTTREVLDRFMQRLLTEPIQTKAFESCPIIWLKNNVKI